MIIDEVASLDETKSFEKQHQSTTMTVMQVTSHHRRINKPFEIIKSNVPGRWSREEAKPPELGCNDDPPVAYSRRWLHMRAAYPSGLTPDPTRRRNYLLLLLMCCKRGGWKH